MKILFLTLLFIQTLFASERIVSLSPSITEILYGLGVGGEIVATSSYSLYPQQAKKLPTIGTYSNLNLEKIISFRPTLIIGQIFNQTSLDKLKYFHIKSLTLKLKTIQSIENSITLLGTVMHKEKEAKKLTTNITNAITAIKKPKKSHTVMIVYGLKEDLRSGIYIAGRNIFFNDIIKLSGNKNAYTENTTAQPVLNYENVIALNPDQIIILHSHATEPNVNVKRALASWYALPTNASKNRRIRILDAEYLYIPSQRVALTIKKLSDEINR